MTVKKYPSLAQLIASGAIASITRTISPRAALVFATLRHRQKGRTAFSLSRADLAAQSGVTVRRVNDVLASLVDAGVIEVKGRGRGRLYSLREPAQWLIRVTNLTSGSRLPGRSGRSAREERLVCLTTSQEMGLEGPDERVRITEFVRRRTTYRAIDRHVCESRGAAMVCDRLHALKISHEIEVPYSELGVKPALDKRGRVKPWRADVVLDRKRLIIEIVGNFDEDYMVNVEAKRRAAIDADWRVFLWSAEELEDLDRTLRVSGLWPKVQEPDSSLYSQGTLRPSGPDKAPVATDDAISTNSMQRQGTLRPSAAAETPGRFADSGHRQGTRRPLHAGPPTFVNALGRNVSASEFAVMEGTASSSIYQPPGPPEGGSTTAAASSDDDPLADLELGEMDYGRWMATACDLSDEQGD